MKDRIKAIRKEVGLTQTDFGKRIGVKGNTITGYETGLRNPSDAILNSICREFNINEVWLRTGEGEPFSTIDENDRYIINLGKLAGVDNEFIKNAVNFIAETEPEKLKVIEDFMRKCLGI